MNHYAQALAELQAQPDHELKQIGDQWQTPKALAWGLFHQFAPTLGPVVLDMFADDCNHLVPHYYYAEDNALTQELAADLRRLGGAAFGNPPYSRPCTDSEGNPITGMEAILNYCREQRALGAKIMLLIKAATSETWWPPAKPGGQKMPTSSSSSAAVSALRYRAGTCPATRRRTSPALAASPQPW